MALLCFWWRLPAKRAVASNLHVAATCILDTSLCPSDCKLPPASLSRAPSLQLTIQLKPKTDSDISGADIACDGQKFCKVCGGLDSVKAACAGRSSCVAFTYNPLDSCGYLKAGSSLVSRKGWVAYVRE